MKTYLLIILALTAPWALAEQNGAAKGAAEASTAAAATDPAEGAAAPKSAQQLFEDGMARARRGDFFGGIEVLREAGEKGHVEAMRIAASMLIDGSFYEDGLALLDKAVATGDPQARLDMAQLIFAQDSEVDRPLDEGRELMAALIQENFPPALFVRASMAEKGYIYEQDEALALKLYLQAAEQGHPPSLGRLYWVYRNGELGQAADSARAQVWKEKREALSSSTDS